MTKRATVWETSPFNFKVQEVLKVQEVRKVRETQKSPSATSTTSKLPELSITVSAQLDLFINSRKICFCSIFGEQALINCLLILWQL